jgi:hypothetical protein
MDLLANSVGAPLIGAKGVTVRGTFDKTYTAQTAVVRALLAETSKPERGGERRHVSQQR